jgi:hypothetical protein
MNRISLYPNLFDFLVEGTRQPIASFAPNPHLDYSHLRRAVKDTPVSGQGSNPAVPCRVGKVALPPLRPWAIFRRDWIALPPEPIVSQGRKDVRA